MSKIKIILIIIGVATLFATLGIFYRGDGTLIGNMPKNTVFRGFPFHFYEANYSRDIYKNLISQKLLPLCLLGNIFIYAIVIASIWQLIVEGVKRNRWLLLIGAAVLGIIFLMINMGGSSYCVAGFPMEFYSKCVGEGNINPDFVLIGLIFDVLFWFSLSAVLIAGFYNLFCFNWFRNFLIYKDVWLTFISAWITIVAMSLLAGIFRISEFAGGIVIAIACAPFLSKTYHYFRKQNKEKGRKFFFSKVGYIALGISMGLVLISFSFNLFYKSGWFDFTDFGFILLSYPLNMIVKFQFDSDIFSKRIILYLISLANLAIIIFILDILGAVCIKIYKNIFNFF